MPSNSFKFSSFASAIAISHLLIAAIAGCNTKVLTEEGSAANRTNFSHTSAHDAASAAPTATRTADSTLGAGLSERELANWESHLRLAENAAESEDFDAAEAHFKAALKFADTLGKGRGIRLQIQSLVHLGAFLSAVERFGDAEQHLNNALALARDNWPDQNITFAITTELAVVLNLTSRFSEAEQLLDSKLESIDPEAELNFELIVSAMHLLSNAQWSQEKYESAADTVEMLLEMILEDDEADATVVAHCLGKLAAARERAGDKAAADQSLVDAIKLVEEGVVDEETSWRTYALAREIASMRGDARAVQFFNNKLASFQRDTRDLPTDSQLPANVAPTPEYNVQAQAAHEELATAQQTFDEVEQYYDAEMQRYSAERDLSQQLAGRLGAIGMFPGSIVAGPVDNHTIMERESARQRLLRAQQAFQAYQQ